MIQHETPSFCLWFYDPRLAWSVLGAGQGPDEIYQSANLYRSSCLFLSSFEVSCGLVHNFTPLTATIARSLSTRQTQFRVQQNPSNLSQCWLLGRWAIALMSHVCSVVLLMKILIITSITDVNVKMREASEPWDAPDTWRPHYCAITLPGRFLRVNTERTCGDLEVTVSTNNTGLSALRDD